MDYGQLFKYICHRKPERSFFIRGHQFPVCARCTGLYTSMFLYIIYAYLVPIHYTITHVIVAVILIIPCFIDGTTQLFEFRESNNTLRFVTGLLAGIGMMIILKIIKLLIMEVI